MTCKARCVIFLQSRPQHRLLNSDLSAAVQLEEAKALLAAKRLEVSDACARQNERTKEKQALCKALAGNALSTTTPLCEPTCACHKLGFCLTPTCLPLHDR